MEQSPNSSEQHQPERLILSVDLSSTQGNPLSLVIQTRELLGDEELEVFGQEVHEANTPGTDKDYTDLLASIDSHVELVDTSGTYPPYGREGKIIAAVKRLHEHILTLPGTVPCLIDGIYPAFDGPDYGPERYLATIREEIEDTVRDIERGDERQREPFERYTAMLQECAGALRRYGVA